MRILCLTITHTRSLPTSHVNKVNNSDCSQAQYEFPILDYGEVRFSRPGLFVN